jgi:hypothetical protein
MQVCHRDSSRDAYARTAMCAVSSGGLEKRVRLGVFSILEIIHFALAK